MTVPILKASRATTATATPVPTRSPVLPPCGPFRGRSCVGLVGGRRRWSPPVTSGM